MNSSVGEILREAREHQGRAIAEVAEELCLTPRYVLAIEQDDVQCLPGLFFYRSFVRQYAQYLGVAMSKLEAALSSSVEVAPIPLPEALVVDPAVESTNRHYFSDRRMGAPFAILMAVVLACTGFYAWWNSSASERALAAVKSVAASVNPSQMPVVNAAGLLISQDSSPQASPPTTLQFTQSANGVDAVVKAVVLNLSANDETWISISSGGKEIFSGTLQPSQSKTVEGLEIATMRIGNAGGVDVRLNGKQIPPLGKRGDVLTVRFTPQDFKIVPPEEPL
jgi:cytoskeleton protein RodZ